MLLPRPVFQCLDCIVFSKTTRRSPFFPEWSMDFQCPGKKGPTRKNSCGSLFLLAQGWANFFGLRATAGFRNCIEDQVGEAVPPQTTRHGPVPVPICILCPYPTPLTVPWNSCSIQPSLLPNPDHPPGPFCSLPPDCTTWKHHPEHQPCSPGAGEPRLWGKRNRRRGARD